ncbi:MAG: hypothetical protein U5R49_24975 [Deltaproteobacteria bacterium]|nr:hypothetical protein [Deltaproteobacteria bacterium]
MKSYLIDELSQGDLAKIRTLLKRVAIPSNLEDVFWIKVPRDLLSDIQFRHEACQPHVFAVEVGDQWIKVEFFVRTLNHMRCECPAYCTRQQRDYAIRFTDGMLTQLNIGS